MKIQTTKQAFDNFQSAWFNFIRACGATKAVKWIDSKLKRNT